MAFGIPPPWAAIRVGDDRVRSGVEPGVAGNVPYGNTGKVGVATLGLDMEGGDVLRFNEPERSPYVVT